MAKPALPLGTELGHYILNDETDIQFEFFCSAPGRSIVNARDIGALQYCGHSFCKFWHSLQRTTSLEKICRDRSNTAYFPLPLVDTVNSVITEFATRSTCHCAGRVCTEFTNFTIATVTFAIAL